MAIVASRGAQKQADEIRRARETKTVRDLEHANEIKAAIEALGPVSLPVKTAADSGKLFGSVTAGDVVAAIKKAGGPNLDKRIVRLPKIAHQGGRHPPGVGAPAPRNQCRGCPRRRRGQLSPHVCSPPAAAVIGRRRV